MDNKQNKKIICKNCGKNNHEVKYCKEPIISYGIILVYLKNELFNKKDDIIKIINNNNNIKLSNNYININSIKDIENFSKYHNLINFLMIQRKHSLCYIEFIRGKYEIDNIDNIISLFQEMTMYEINLIKNSTFDKLWNNLWGENNILHNDYYKAKKKFELFVNNEDINLKFVLNIVKPLWDFSEWGFPKGKKISKQENNLICAKREFEEETGLSSNDYTILDNINPINEDFIGTNGIKYRHIYYLAIYNQNNDSININIDNLQQNIEVSNIQFLNYDNCYNVIRPYHEAKKKILTNIFIFILDLIIKNINV